MTSDAPAVLPTEAVPPVEARTSDAAPEDGAANAVTIPDWMKPAGMVPVVSDDPRRGFVLRVRALQAARWRIGRKFTAEPVEIEAESLSEDQMQALMGDPLLAVEVIAPD